jgi:membrane-bound lytic murein transglycosylase A
LFAQDHGRAIKGNGRFDLYTGVGGDAESAAYSVTGLHRVFMLVRKPG